MKQNILLIISTVIFIAAIITSGAMTNWWQGESKNVQPIPTPIPTAAPTAAPTVPAFPNTIVVTPDPILEKYKNVTGGDIKTYLYNGKNYRLHIFSNQGNFTFKVPENLTLLSINYILVGGGGGGFGWNSSCNGGAGGGGGQIMKVEVALE